MALFFWSEQISCDSVREVLTFANSYYVYRKLGRIQFKGALPMSSHQTWYKNRKYVEAADNAKHYKERAVCFHKENDVTKAHLYELAITQTILWVDTGMSLMNDEKTVNQLPTLEVPRPVFDQCKKNSWLFSYQTNLVKCLTQDMIHVG